MPLDIEAFGDPGAVICRWCGTGRVLVRGTLFCTSCDAPGLGLLLPTWREERPAA